MKKLKLTLGLDPEFMLMSSSMNRIVSAIPIMKNSKENPMLLDRGVRIYADNALLEAAFPPSNSRWECVDRIRDAVNQTQDALAKNLSLHPKASHEYDNDELKDKRAWEAGCDPSLDVWERQENPIKGFTSNLRSGSFHIHIGNRSWPESNEGILLNDESREMAVKLMDIYVGACSVVFDKDPTSKDRRKLYGKAGEFRRCDYGVEYRVLGPYALRSPDLTDLVFMLTEYAMSTLESGDAPDIIKAVPISLIKEAINNCNIDSAKEIMRISGLPNYYVKRVNEDRSLAANMNLW